MRRAVVLLVLLAVSVSNVVHAQGEEAFAGEWKSPGETGGIVGANVYKDGTRWVVQLLGSCRPTPCVWNPEPLVVLEASGRAGGPPRALATFQQSNMRRVMTFRLGEESMLVEVYSMQLPVRSRGVTGRNYYSVDELRRTQKTAKPLSPTRPPVPPVQPR